MLARRVSGAVSSEAVIMSEAARELRVAMRWTLAAAVACLVLVFGSARGWVPRETAPLLLGAFVLACAAAIWLGLKSHRQALADRDRVGRLSLIVTIAAQLGKQDDATLSRIAGKSGPAGEAARMILTERRNRQTRGSSPAGPARS
jgi:hypothetical protein